MNRIDILTAMMKHSDVIPDLDIDNNVPQPTDAPRAEDEEADTGKQQPVNINITINTGSGMDKDQILNILKNIRRK